MKHKSPTVRVSAMQILAKKCISNVNLYPKLVKSWADKNSRVRREIMNGIGINHHSSSSFIIVIDAH